MEIKTKIVLKHLINEACRNIHGGVALSVWNRPDSINAKAFAVFFRGGTSGCALNIISLLRDEITETLTHAILDSMGETKLCNNETFVEEFSNRLSKAIQTARF